MCGIGANPCTFNFDSYSLRPQEVHTWGCSYCNSTKAMRRYIAIVSESLYPSYHILFGLVKSAGLPACFVDVPVTVVVVFLVFPLGADFYDPPLPPSPPASFHIALYHLICCSSSFLRPVVASWFVCVSGCTPAPCPLCVPWLPPLRLACLFWSVCSPCLLLPFLLVLMLAVSFSCLMFLAWFLCFAFCHSLKLAPRFAHALFFVSRFTR